jgi:hypothetical protein
MGMGSATTGGPNQTTYAAKSQWYLFLPLIVCGVIAAAAALGLGLGAEFVKRAHVGPFKGSDIAFVLSGVAALVAVCGAWSWRGALRWVAVSADGIRWRRGGATHFRRWDEVEQVKRVSFEIRLDGQKDKNPARWVEVHFHSGPYLHLSDSLVERYGDLIDDIEAHSANRSLAASSGQYSH